VAGEPKNYTQEELDAILAEKVGELDGLKRNQAEAIKEAKAAKAKLAGYEGIDPEEFKRLKQAADDAEKKRLAGEGDFKALEAQLVKKMADQEAAHTVTTQRYRGAIEQHLIDAEAVRELAQHSDSPGLLLPHVKSQMKVMEESDGKFVARVVDASGNVRIGKGAGAAPMTLPELMEEMKADKTFAPAFRGSGSSGGGATRSTGGASGGVATIAAGDKKGFIDNVEAIAKGKVNVV